MLHLDASVVESIVVDANNVVLEWLDLSGNGNNAVPSLQKGNGIVIYDGNALMPNGVAGLDFGDEHNQLRLLPNADIPYLLNLDPNDPNGSDNSGFCVAVAFQVDTVINNWNDLIGNSTICGDGFFMRWHPTNSIQAGLDGCITVADTNQVVADGDAMVMTFNYDAVAGIYNFWNSKHGVSDIGYKAASNFNERNFDFTLGGMHNSGRYFDGIISEVLIYDTALSDDEVVNLQDSLVSKWVLPEPISLYVDPNAL